MSPMTVIATSATQNVTGHLNNRFTVHVWKVLVFAWWYSLFVSQTGLEVVSPGHSHGSLSFSHFLSVSGPRKGSVLSTWGCCVENDCGGGVVMPSFVSMHTATVIPCPYIYSCSSILYHRHIKHQYKKHTRFWIYNPVMAIQVMEPDFENKYPRRGDRLQEEPSAKNAQGLFPPDACIFVGK